MDNLTIARRLREYARYLERQEDNLFRVKAYRRGAAVVESLRQPVHELIAAGGRQRLEEIPGIGKHFAYTIETLVHTGEFHTVHSPREFLSPERIAGSLPDSRADSTMKWADKTTDHSSLFSMSG